MVKKYFRYAFVLILVTLLVSPTMKISAADEGPWLITVNDTSDVPDAVHNSVCDTVEQEREGGVCTLRAAIDEANKCLLTACPQGVVIQVPSGTYTLTIPPVNPNDNSTGDLNIYNPNDLPSYIIEGTDPANPPIIDANGLDRVLHVGESSTPITLRNLIIRGGTLIKIDEITSGMEGAGVLNYGHLTLENVIIENNQFLCPSNSVKVCEGYGGGILTNDYLLMEASTVRNNTAFVGGGIFTAGLAEVKILSSTISDNLAVYGGGGIVNVVEQLQIENSTISDNSSESFGGIFNWGDMSLFNVTIAGNTATSGGGANLYNSSGTIKVSNSIIAYPIGPYLTENCLNSGNLINLGINIYSDSSCGTGENILSNTDPRLTPLAWLGGPTMTRGLLAGSSAHDAAAGLCTDYIGNALTIDQRGANRDSLCDLGAFEGVAYSVYLPVLHR